MTLRDSAASAPTSPVASFVDPDLVAELDAAKQAGTLETLAHADVLAQGSGSGWLDSLSGAALLRDMAGNARTDAGEVRADLGSPVANTAQAQLPLSLVAGAEMDGVLLADVGQGRGELSYDPAGAARVHLPHGGRYPIQGLRRVATQARTEGSHVLAAAAQEGTLGVFDLAEESIEGVLPVLAEFLETTRDGALNVDPSSRHPSPPLLALVHGERTMAGRLVQPFSHAGRDASAWHPSPIRAEQVGMTKTELNLCLSVQLAACVVAGYLPIFPWEPTLHAWRMKLGDDDPVLPMLGQVHQAFTLSEWCADFLRGIPCPPFVTDVSDAGDDAGDDAGGLRETTENPLAKLRYVNRVIWDRVAPPSLSPWSDGGDAGDDAGDDADTTTPTGTTGMDAMHLPFRIPSVLAGVWRERATDDVCLVLVNWTDAEATWGGQFIPFYCGWPAGQAGDDAGDDAAGVPYRIDQLIGGQSDAGNDAGDDAGNLTELTIPVYSGLRGPQHVMCSGTQGTRASYGTVFLGPVPSFSIQAYRFQQE